MSGTKPKGYLAYKIAVAHRTWVEAKEYGSANLVFPILGAISGAVGTIIVLRLHLGSAEFSKMNLWETAIVPTQGAIVGILLSIPLAALWFWITSPQKMHWERETKIKALEARLTPGHNLTLYNANVPDPHKILAGWYLRIDAFNASEVFEVQLDLSHIGGGFHNTPTFLVHASWDDEDMAVRYISNGAHASALIAFREIFEHGYVPRVRALSKMNAKVEYSGSGYDDTNKPEYSIGVLVSAGSGGIKQKFTITFCGSDIKSISGDKPEIELSNDILANA